MKKIDTKIIFCLFDYYDEIKDIDQKRLNKLTDQGYYIKQISAINTNSTNSSYGVAVLLERKHTESPHTVPMVTSAEGWNNYEKHIVRENAKMLVKCLNSTEREKLKEELFG